MNKKALLIILIILNIGALAIEPILGGVFFLMWIYWYKQHIKEFEY